jgi:hypothetical protein
LFQGLPNFLVYLAPRFKQLRDERLWPWIQNTLSRIKEESDLSNNQLRLSQMSQTSHDSENKGVIDMLKELGEEMDDDGEKEEMDDDDEKKEMEEDDDDDDEKEEKQIEADTDEEANHNGASHADDVGAKGFGATDGPQKHVKWIDATLDEFSKNNDVKKYDAKLK